MRGASPYVLVVEKDDVFRATLCEGLKRHGLEAIGLGSGAAALTFLRAAQPPCLLVCGLYVGNDVSGWMIATECRSNCRLRHTAVIFLTSSTDDVPEDFPVLRKPFRVSELVFIARHHCRKLDGATTDG